MSPSFHRRRLQLQMILLGVLCVVGSFALGIHSSGDLRTIASLEAGMPLGDSDANGDGTADLEDAIEFLEVVRGYRDLEPRHVRADPNSDGQITVDDVLQLLHDLTRL